DTRLPLSSQCWQDLRVRDPDAKFDLIPVTSTARTPPDPQRLRLGSSSSAPSLPPALLTARFAGLAESLLVGRAGQSPSTSSVPSAGSSHACWASRSARITGMRSWIGATTPLEAESQV